MSHEWERVYDDDGEPLLLMRCARCRRVRGPSQSERDLGKCHPIEVAGSVQPNE